MSCDQEISRIRLETTCLYTNFWPHRGLCTSIVKYIEVYEEKTHAVTKFNTNRF